MRSIVLLALTCHALLASAQSLRIEHVQVRSPERAELLRDASVEIRGGRITAVTTGRLSKRSRQTIDGRDLFLAPGLIDSHVHLTNVPGMTPPQEAHHPDLGAIARRQMPRSFLYFGFTTLIDLTGTPQTVARFTSHGPAPDTYFCGAAPILGGYPMNYASEATRYQEMPYFILDAGAAAPAGTDADAHSPEAVVARMKRDGAICVKTFFDRGPDPSASLPVPKLATVRALVEAAHAAGLPVLLHATTPEAQTFGIDAGVDVMAHGVLSWGADAPHGASLTPAVRAVLDGVARANMGWQPTFRVGLGFRDLLLPAFLSEPLLISVIPKELLDWYRTTEGRSFHDSLAAGLLEAQVRAVYADSQEKLAAEVRYLAEHGGKLLFGTDTPSAPLYSNPPGLNGWWEMQAWRAAGITPAQIFKSATLDNARALHLDTELGTVEAGKRANLLLLHQDPAQTIDTFAHIDAVILDGELLRPTKLSADHPKGPNSRSAP